MSTEQPNGRTRELDGSPIDAAIGRLEKLADVSAHAIVEDDEWVGDYLNDGGYEADLRLVLAAILKPAPGLGDGDLEWLRSLQGLGGTMPPPGQFEVGQRASRILAALGGGA